MFRRLKAAPHSGLAIRFYKGLQMKQALRRKLDRISLGKILLCGLEEKFFSGEIFQGFTAGNVQHNCGKCWQKRNKIDTFVG